MEWTEILNLVLAGLAILVSLAAICVSLYTWYRTDKRDRDRRADEIRERDSAKILVTTEPSDSPGYYNIVLRNKGNCRARLQYISDGSRDIHKHPNSVLKTPTHTEIPPIDGKIIYPMRNIPKNGFPVKIHVIWDDDYKKGNEENFPLT